MLRLRRGTVVTAEAGSRVQRFTVRLDDGEERRAISYPQLTGAVQPGDDVVVNTAAQDLGLGSGGFDILHLGPLPAAGEDGEVHVMKLNYTSLQHAVAPVEDGLEQLDRPLAMPVGVLALHGQLPPAAFALGGRRVGYVQTAGGALPGPLSEVAAELLERGLICDHVTAGASFGGGRDAITVEGALDAGARRYGWDGALVGPGPGILGSASALGHGGLSALSNAHAALALGCPVVVAPRLSSGDPRARHRGVSHHTATVLDLLLAPVEVAVPRGADADVVPLLAGSDHVAVEVDVAGLLDEYVKSGLPAKTMGRGVEEDRDFFLAGLAGGAALAMRIDGGAA
jgi:hypothetical protein